jgi:hypothetical protein
MHFQLPQGVNADSVDDTRCTIESGAVICEFGLIQAGAANAISVNLQVTALNSDGVMANNAVIFSPYLDSLPDNNQVLEETLVSNFENTPPIAVSDKIFALPEQEVTADIVANDTDPDGQTLSIVEGSITPMGIDTQGVLQKLDGQQVKYTPPTTVGGVPFVGRSYYTYRVSDDNAESSDTEVEVIVNTPPVANDDQATVVSGYDVTVLVTANDSDGDDDEISLDSIDTNGLVGGSAAIGPNNTIIYTSNAGYEGTDQMTYTIMDDKEGYSSATLFITSQAEDANSGGDDNSGGGNQTSSSSGGGSLDYIFYIFFLFVSMVTKVRNK